MDAARVPRLVERIRSTSGVLTSRASRATDRARRARVGAGLLGHSRAAQDVLREATASEADVELWTGSSRARANLERRSSWPRNRDAELEAEADKAVEALERTLPASGRSGCSPASTDERPAIVNSTPAPGHGGDGLGRDAPPEVRPLGGPPPLEDRDHRQQEGEQRDQERRSPSRAAGLWLGCARAGRPPPGADHPFEAQNRRQTTFALVEVMPSPTRTRHRARLGPDPRRYLSLAGAGGQHVNKTDSAVAAISRQGSSPSHRTSAPDPEQRRGDQVLKARPPGAPAGGEGGRAAAAARRALEAGWGNQIRSYVLHPTRWSRTSGRRSRRRTRPRPRRRPRYLHAGGAGAARDGRDGRARGRDSPLPSRSRSRGLDGIAFRHATEADLPRVQPIHRVASTTT